jgi:hypothetical protein
MIRLPYIVEFVDPLTVLVYGSVDHLRLGATVRAVTNTLRLRTGCCTLGTTGTVFIFDRTGTRLKATTPWKQAIAAIQLGDYLIEDELP